MTFNYFQHNFYKLTTNSHTSSARVWGKDKKPDER